MPLKTLVKVGSLTNLSDARYCAGMDVQMLGFQAIPGLPNYVTPGRFQEIRGWISGPAIVIELHGAQSRHQIDEAIEAYGPDYLEVGLAELHLVSNLSLPLIVRVKRNEPLEQFEVDPAYALIDDDDDRSFPMPSIVQVSSMEGTKNALGNKLVSGIALKGSEELSPGLKTYETLAPILEMLEED
jgi:phosphoribosylanthranilate isomerase